MGKTILVKADNAGDLSGSTVVSKDGCEKFVVFAGSKCSQSEYSSGNCAGCDHLYTQLIPRVALWETVLSRTFCLTSRQLCRKGHCLRG